ncbi:glycoside hydrolase family 17 protein [Lentinula edodes]|uniref:glucan endo-1,3-beta-D-glucosidase n=1 Tax=Lentinula edodes TaxID=5353 RepID=A0A1Q3E587_LENED|nr:glycoside hydrolase family 17 protein [Lentinula edodes]
MNTTEPSPLLITGELLGSKRARTISTSSVDTIRINSGKKKSTSSNKRARASEPSSGSGCDQNILEDIRRIRQRKSSTYSADTIRAPESSAVTFPIFCDPPERTSPQSETPSTAASKKKDPRKVTPPQLNPGKTAPSVAVTSVRHAPPPPIITNLVVPAMIKHRRKSQHGKINGIMCIPECQILRSPSAFTRNSLSSTYGICLMIPARLHLTLKNPQQWKELPSEPDIRYIDIKCNTFEYRPLSEYYPPEYSVSYTGASSAEYADPAIVPADLTRGIIVNKRWNKTFPGNKFHFKESLITNFGRLPDDSINTHSKDDGDSISKRGWFFKFMIPIPSWVLRQGNTRAFIVETMYSQPRGSSPSIANSELNDYYDQLPPPHRLSSFSTNSTTHLAETYTDVPAPIRTRPYYGDRRGEFPETPFVEEKASTRSSRKKWIVWGLVVVGLLAVAGAVAGVVISQTSKSSSSSGSNLAITGDPSQFSKDSRLKQSFYGIAYTPEDSIYPNCNIQLADVVTDMQLLSQLTSRIRLYGSDCNTTAMVLEAIQLTQVNMTVFIANYPDATDNGVAYNRQKTAIESAIQAYGTDHIGGVTVGNEFILDYLDANGATDPNGSVGNQGAAILTPLIDDTKSMLQSLGVTLKVGNADAGSFFNDKVLADVDYGMANVHPWFANVSIDAAAGHVHRRNRYFFQNSSDAGNESNGASTASEANLQTFIDTFVCQANANGTEYFFFEYFDEPWKTQQFGGVEGYWGLFYSNRTLKNIEIPDC